MTNELNSRLDAYVHQDKAELLDDRFDWYLEQLLQKIKDAVAQSNPDDKLRSLLAQLALVFPIHITRKHVDLLHDGSEEALRGCFQDTSLREALGEVFRTVTKEKPSLPWIIKDPIDIIGFDPRHLYPAKSTEKEKVKSTEDDYRKIAIPGAAAGEVPLGRVDFFSDYNKAKSAIYLDFHDRSTRYDLLVVDFSWLPELAYQGHIIPLERFGVHDLKERIREILKLPENPAELWSEVLCHLTSAGNTLHYGLPLFLNAHQRLMKKDHHYEDEHGIDAISCQDLKKCTVQTARSACCVYALYAHFAYCGASPISVVSTRSFTTSPGRQPGLQYHVKVDGFAASEAKTAIAQYLARVHLVSKAKDNEFRYDHNSEKNKQLDSSYWSLTLNSEFGEDWTERESKRAFKFPDRERYLTSLGGYAVAVSRQAVNPQKALDMAWTIFSKSQGMIPSTLRDLTCSDITSFQKFHCRPRVPFWSEIEHLIAITVQELYEAILKDDSLKRSLQDSKTQTFDTYYTPIMNALTDESRLLPYLSKLDRSVREVFETNGWRVE